MSSTARASDRIPLDDYPTPRWCVHRLLERESLPSGLWFEPCAGAGSIIRAAQSVRPDVTWRANEINRAYAPHLEALGVDCTFTDATELDIRFGPRVIITNPPFALSVPILERCLRERMYGALTIFLQRLNWAAGPRRELFRKHRPSALVLPDRPSFVDVVDVGTGKLKPGTDSIEYAWFIFDGLGRFEVLGDTPRDVRAAEIAERREARFLVAA